MTELASTPDQSEPSVSSSPDQTIVASDAAQITAGTSTSSITIDLDQIAADLADVEVALARLDTGTYWTDEVTGEPLSDEWMVAHPTARRADA